MRSGSAGRHSTMPRHPLPNERRRPHMDKLARHGTRIGRQSRTQRDSARRRNDGMALERDGPAPCEIGKPCFNLLSTTDGGNQWRTVLARTAMTDLRFVDRTHGWSLIPSDGGVDVIATADGGTTWARQIAGEEILGLSVPNVDVAVALARAGGYCTARDRKSTRLNSSHRTISYAVFCLKKKKK